mmetsp:Transcript_46033/g.68543  ORF Transcript_46033/g.68543 Transcript_46033/m.68543 type:complete len:266 (+) Transcript_46033:1561-2358(+)
MFLLLAGRFFRPTRHGVHRRSFPHEISPRRISKMMLNIVAALVVRHLVHIMRLIIVNTVIALVICTLRNWLQFPSCPVPTSLRVANVALPYKTKLVEQFLSRWIERTRALVSSLFPNPFFKRLIFPVSFRNEAMPFILLEFDQLFVLHHPPIHILLHPCEANIVEKLNATRLQVSFRTVNFLIIHPRRQLPIFYPISRDSAVTVLSPVLLEALVHCFPFSFLVLLHGFPAESNIFEERHLRLGQVILSSTSQSGYPFPQICVVPC